MPVPDPVRLPPSLISSLVVLRTVVSNAMLPQKSAIVVPTSTRRCQKSPI